VKGQINSKIMDIFQIIEDFADKDETKNLEFGNKLEEVVVLMES
jgi:hypothetical protein